MRHLAILVTLLFASSSWASPTACPPPPTVKIDWVGTLTGCSPGTSPCAASEPIQFSAKPISGSFAACHVFDWDFGDGFPHSSLQNPTHSFASTGTFPIFLKVTNAAGQEQSDGNGLTVVAATTLPSIDDFNATPSRVTLGQSVVFSWITRNASQGIRIVNVHPTSVQAVIDRVSTKASGTIQFTPRETMTYTLTAKGDAGTQTKQITVEVVIVKRGRAVKH